MESNPLPRPVPRQEPPQAPSAPDDPPSPDEQAAPRLDLSRMEPPRRLAEARLEEVTIDGICGVY